MQHKLYKKLAILVQARLNCIERGNTEWRDRHEKRINQLVKKYMPCGAGFDTGVAIDLERSTRNALVFHTSFSHMNGDGYYTSWTDHDLIVTPDLAFDYNQRITGRNKDDIKDYMHVCFGVALDSIVDDDAEQQAA